MAVKVQRRQWSGLERQLVIKLRNAMLSVQARDERATERAAALGVDGYYFAQNSGDPVYLAMVTLMNRINVVLAARA